MVSSLCIVKVGNMLQARNKETILQKFRQKAQKRAGAASGVSDQNVSEMDKMCMQLFLDLQVTLLVIFHSVV